MAIATEDLTTWRKYVESRAKVHYEAMVDSRRFGNEEIAVRNEVLWRLCEEVAEDARRAEAAL